MLTLTTALVDVPAAPAVPGVDVRPLTSADVEPLARLSFDAYDPGEAWATPQAALADVLATFEGEYGPLHPAASLGAWSGADLAGALLVVASVPRPDVPPGPFAVELLTARAWRRRGVARLLLDRAAEALGRSGRLTLRVHEANDPARRLYADVGFAVVTDL